MQFVGIVLPTQTLPWQNATLSADFTLPDTCFGFLIYGTFFPLSSSLVHFFLIPL